MIAATSGRERKAPLILPSPPFFGLPDKLISLYDSRMKFSKQDTLQLKKQGIPVSKAAGQLERLKKGFPFVRLIRPGMAGDGIFRLNAREQKIYQGRLV